MKNLSYTIDEAVAGQRYQRLLEEAENCRIIKNLSPHKASQPWWDRLKKTFVLFLG